MTTGFNDSIKYYSENGFVVLDIYDSQAVDKITSFSREWLYQLLNKWVKDRYDDYPIKDYHKWGNELQVEHSSIFIAANRHKTPPADLLDILFNDKMKLFLKTIIDGDYYLWDEGLGSLAFRLIRPGRGDGYPFSRKEWGPAKEVISMWIPVVGYSSNETLGLIPASHNKEYEKYLPDDTKFRKDEYRMVSPPSMSDCHRPELKKGEIIMYHPRLIHTEDVLESDITRFNLEIRIVPKK